MRTQVIQPSEWKRPKGYSNGIAVEGAPRLLFLAGQVAWDEEQRLVGAGDLVVQFGQALANVLRLVREAGGVSENLVRFTIFVKDKRDYLAHTQDIGRVYRGLMGKHYPAMSLVQVADLLEEGALVEIEATAAMP